MQEAGRQIEQLGEAFARTGPTQAAIANKVGGLAGRLMAGARVDFPQVWKNSGFTPSYTMTVRLYNPRPGNYTATKKYIIGPLAALLLLGLPISSDGDTYNWPFLHKIRCPGIYNLNPAFISNITVVKGGDQQQISHKQTMGIVDVRIDFGSLYNSILAEEGNRKLANRPTLNSYLKALEDYKPIEDIYKAPNEASKSEISLIRNPFSVRDRRTEKIALIPNPFTARRSQASSGFETEAQSRVSAGDKNMENSLVAKSSEDAAGFIPT